MNKYGLIIIAILILINLIGGLTLFIHIMNQSEEVEYITMSEFYSQITWTPRSASEYFVEFVNYEPGDIVQIMDEITNLNVSSHMSTALGYKSLGNHSYLTWPYIDGDLSQYLKVGDIVLIELEIQLDIDPYNGKEGEWFKTVRGDEIDYKSIIRIEDPTEDIQIDEDFKPHQISYNVWSHVDIDFENLTLIEFSIFHNETPYFIFGFFQGEGSNGNGTSFHHGIDNFSIGVHSIKICVTVGGVLLDTKEIEMNIQEHDENNISINVYENHIIVKKDSIF